MNQNDVLKNLLENTEGAVAHYWQTRSIQRKKQEQSGKADQGLRSAVTGGAQMDGFIDLLYRTCNQGRNHRTIYIPEKGC